MVPELAVIIVTYNGEKTIKRCIESVLQSSILTMIYVVDNNSTDNTTKILKNYDSYRNIKILLLDKNYGFGVGNNKGIKLALRNGLKEIFLLNQDAYIGSNTIYTLQRVIRKFPEFGVISPLQYVQDPGSYHNSMHINQSYCGYKNTCLEPVFTEYGLNSSIEGLTWLKEYEQNFHTVSHHFFSTSQKPFLFCKKPLTVSFVNAASWMVSKCVFDKIGGFHPAFFMYSEDNEFLQRLQNAGMKVGISTQSAVIHDRNEKLLTEKKGVALRNNPLRVFNGLTLNIALNREIEKGNKRIMIYIEMIKFIKQSIKKWKYKNIIKSYIIARESLTYLSTDPIIEAKKSVFEN